MHPSLQAKYNLRSADDVALADLFLAAAEKANLSDAQAHGLLQFYSTVAPALERGQLTRDDALAQLKDFAELQGVGSDECTALLGWRGKTETYIDTHGELPERAPLSAGVREEMIKEIEATLQQDPSRYYSDALLQNQLHDLIAQRQAASTTPPPIATRAQVRRLGELEKLMGDTNSAYWAPGTGPALQAEFRRILNLGAPESARVALAAPSRSSGRRAEIEKMMGDQGSEYWRGPRANEIQNEYRGLLSAPEAAAPDSTTSPSATQEDK